MKKILYVALVVVLVLIINGLAHSIYDLWSKQDIVTSARQTLEKEKAKNEELKKELEVAQSPQFVESEARNKLFLTKPQEKEIVIPTQSSPTKQNTSSLIPNWQKWLNLFIF